MELRKQLPVSEMEAELYHFSVAETEHHDQGVLQKEGFTWLTL